MEACDGLIVNGLTFCTDHGSEFCDECCSDHRPVNDTILNLNEKTISRIVEACGNINKRPPLNAYHLGATLSHRNGDHETYRCTKHGTVDCKECFNWNRWILGSADMVEELKAAVNPLAQLNLTQRAACF